ncbi:hypothetical protein HMI54_015186 [Coelomomyces lativittatus]|nr:hypothetical protein HMI54_015186 [Coelomomyces lativittatus]
MSSPMCSSRKLCGGFMTSLHLFSSLGWLTLWALLASCFLFNTGGGVWAVPGVFHDANTLDIYGKQCPLPSFLNLECPLLCTTNIEYCPTSLQPTCDPTEVFCPHGECVPNPTNLAWDAVCPLTTQPNVCGCPEHPSGMNLNSSQVWFPCVSNSYARYSVNLTATPHRLKDELLQTTCHELLDPSRASFLKYLHCEAKVPSFTFHEPIWLSFWSVLACQCLLLLAYVPMKWTLENRSNQAWKAKKSGFDPTSSKSLHSFLSPIEGCHPIPSSKEHVTEFYDEPKEETLTFYHTNMLGHIAYYMTLMYTMFIFVFLQLIIGDYYTTLNGPATFFVHESLIPCTFIVIWHGLVFLLVVWKVKTPLAIRQFFRIRTSNPLNAQYVVVRRKMDPSTTLLPLKHTFAWLKWILKLLQRMEAWATQHFQLSVQSTCHRIHLTQHRQIPYFYDTAFRYMYSCSLHTFRPHTFKLGASLGQLLQSTQAVYEQGGLSLEQVQDRLEWLGPNRIHLKPPHFLKLLGQEFSGWFYIYQFSMLQVWYYFLYWKMGLILTVFILGAAIIKSIVRFKAYRRIHALVSKSTKVVVLRHQKPVEVEDTQLVPGDILVFSNGEGKPLTVDVLVMKGRVLVDESCISGESKPINKTPIPSDLYASYQHVPIDLNHHHHPHPHHHHHVVLAGSSILQAEKSAYGVVLTTQLHSSRGHLIQKLLRPSTTLSAFHDQLKVVVLFLLLWGTLCFSIVVYFMWDGTSTAWFYAVFMITEIISPLLPAVLVAGQSVAANRLIQHQITCTDLERIALAGKTKYFCFDKTGTLTQKQLAFSHFLSHRLLSLSTSELSFHQLEALATVDDATRLSTLERDGFLTCHSLTMFDGKVVGHPVESAMFEFMNASSPSSNFGLLGDTVMDSQGHPLASLVHRFPFDHELQSMGVVVQLTPTPPLDSNTTLANLEYRIYFKGAYEKIRAYCTHVPCFFDDACRKATKAGGYVLALATKSTNVIPKNRHEAMLDLQWTGLFVFRNLLKKDTTEVIRTIQHGGCETIMITGDALFTGIHVARECGFLASSDPLPTSSSYPCLYTDFDVHGNLVWHDATTDVLVSTLNQPSDFFSKMDLAVTGQAWDYFMQQDSPPSFLKRIKVFARMAPDQKSQVVQALMAHGVVAMCGDGANDCSALHTATVGIALSDCESALVAPFATSSTTSLNACVRVLTEGRSALASSFAGYKFLIMYGMTMSSMCLTMYYFQIVLPQFIWISIDGVIVVASCITLTRAKSLNTLSSSRPTMNLLGVQTIGSILLHTLTHWSFLIGAVYYLFQQAWFRCNEFDPFAIDLSKWWLLGDNYEASVISTMVIFQFINNGAIFNFGDRFRQAWYTNTFYVMFYLLCMTIMSWIVLADPFYLNCLYRINCGNPNELVSLGLPKPSFDIPLYNSSLGHNVMPVYFRWPLWGLAMANALLCLIVERWVILGVLPYFFSKKKKKEATKIV